MKSRLQFLAWAIPMFLLCGCGPGNGEAGDDDSATIRIEGSDTMVNLAQAWAEKYDEKHPEVSVQVLGGGSGVGIAALINGTCEMANSSREMTEKEIRLAKQQAGVEPVEFTVGHDALAVYVHKDNPVDSISLEELAEIYGDGGNTTNWSQLKGGANLEITRVSRQNNSGTYFYFHEAVLGKTREYKLGSVDLSGSKDVVALVSRTPGAIGYSGMGYATDEVKMLKISAKKGEPGVSPSVESVKNSSYPITRPLYIYTAGEPTGNVKEFLDWVRGPEGQAVVTELGYVPAKDHE